MMKYKWILFDADNTLFDFTSSQRNALKHTFESFGLGYNSDIFSDFTKLNNIIWQAYDENKITHEQIKTERFRVLFESLNIENVDLFKFNLEFIDNLIKYSKLFDGTKDFLLSISGKVKIAIITNGMKEVQRPRFENCKIKSIFDNIFISGEMGTSKPNHDYFEFVHINSDNLDKKDYLVVGDNSMADIMGGKKYGFDTCFFNPHSLKNEHKEYSDYEIKNIKELSIILE